MGTPGSPVHRKTAAKMGVLMTSLHFPWQGRGAECPSSAPDRCLNHITLHMCTRFGDSGYISGDKIQEIMHSPIQKEEREFSLSS